MPSATNASRSPGTRLGPIRLADGVTAGHAASYLYASFAGICLTTFIGVFLPYVLNVNLGLPAQLQGRVAGDMGFYRELVLIALSSLIGVASDRTGRRPLFVAGLLILGLGYVGYGWVNSLATLIAAQVFLAFGIALVNVMVVAVQVDYAAEQSRGKLVGATGIAIGLGAMTIGLVFTRVPSWITAQGSSELEAGRYTMLVMTALALLTAVAARVGLKGGPPPQTQGATKLRSMLLQGFVAARDNPRILLGYACAFVSRGDLVVVGTFYTLWLTQAGLAAGMSPEDAAKTAGVYFGLCMGVALLWAPVMGVINDRTDRTSAMAFALLLAAVGYIAMGAIEEPLGPWMYVGAVLLGIGQMSTVSASQTLIGQESPAAARGAITGVFSLCGAGGILFITKIGGQIFDSIGPAAPFVLIGTINGALFVAAAALRLRAKT